jgi:hypothetical protein
LQGRRDEVFAGLRGGVGNHFTYSGRISWWNFKNLPTFLNDTGDHKQFYVLFENVKALSFHAGARYVMANIWSAGLTGDLYTFYDISDQYASSEPYVWHEPSLRIKGDFMAQPVEKLMVGAYLAMLSGIHARDATYHTVDIKPFVDLGINGEYQFISRLSAFVQLSNLLGTRYQRWYGYEAYGLNIYGGIRLKF